MASSGFCILNVIAVAAAYARSKYGNLNQVQSLMSNLDSYSTSSSSSSSSSNTISSSCSSGIDSGSIYNSNINSSRRSSGKFDTKSVSLDQDDSVSDFGDHVESIRDVMGSLNQIKQFPRIAIIDFDIHHGNGTEEIVRNLKPREVFLPLPSSWAPISKFKFKPWWNENDPNDVHFSSVQLYSGDNFYPCSGADEIQTSSTQDADFMASNTSSTLAGVRSNDGNFSVFGGSNIVNIGLTAIAGTSKTMSQKKKKEACDQASLEFRSKISAMLLPRLREFKPDLMFISAGFDGHVDDKYHYLTDEDYHWVTEALCEIAEDNEAPVISILEGGYSLSSPSNTATAPSSSSTRNSGSSSSKSESQASLCDSLPLTAPFAVKSGDGGLVKGVLAHTAALANLNKWI